MQQRHQDRELYFKEQAQTCHKHYLPYLQSFISITPDTRILEIGCGEGGNLLPLAQMGCQVTGIDLAAERIAEAQSFFKQSNASVHDVIEHIVDKEQLLIAIKRLLTPDGLLFIAFPAWQMPFGGHQQICHNSTLAHLPFIHLLPRTVYRHLLRIANESEENIHELMNIRHTRTTIEDFEALALKHYQLTNRQLWFINPHYETKFHLQPRKLWKPIKHIPYLRGFCCTACWYLLKGQTSTK